MSPELACILNAIISPIPVMSKDDDRYVPFNYRGASLPCCIAKQYSSSLNNRQTSYFNTVNLPSDFQNGSRKKENL